MNILSSGKNSLRMLKKEYIKLTSLSFLTGHCPLDKHHQTEISRKFGVSISFDGPLSTFEAAIFRTRLESGAAAILCSKLPQIGTRSCVRTVCKDCVCVVNNLMSRQHCKQVFKKKKDGVYVINLPSLKPEIALKGRLEPLWMIINKRILQRKGISLYLLTRKCVGKGYSKLLMYRAVKCINKMLCCS